MTRTDPDLRPTPWYIDVLVAAITRPAATAALIATPPAALAYALPLSSVLPGPTVPPTNDAAAVFLAVWVTVWLFIRRPY